MLPFKESQPSAPQQSSGPAVPPQEDTRWDLDKAETVGKAIYHKAEKLHELHHGGNPFNMEPPPPYPRSSTVIPL